MYTRTYQYVFYIEEIKSLFVYHEDQHLYTPSSLFKRVKRKKFATKNAKIKNSTRKKKHSIHKDTNLCGGMHVLTSRECAGRPKVM